MHVLSLKISNAQVFWKCRMLSSGYKYKPRSNIKANEVKYQYNLLIKRICFSHRCRSIVQDDETISEKQLTTLCRVLIVHF